VSYGYDVLGRRVTVTDVLGGVTETSYTPGGRVGWVDDPTDRRTSYSYDDAGRVETITGPGSHVTTYGYDEDSRVVSTTSPEGDVTATTFDEVGRVLTATDPAGVVTTNTWSLRGELLTQGVSGAGTVEYSYNLDGTLDWADDALNNRTSFSYDDRGRETARTDAGSNVWATGWNAAGEKVAETDPLNRTTTFTYDDAGRQVTVADPSGRTTTNTWSPGGLLDGWSATDGVNTLTAAFSYDPAGRRSAATLGGRTWTYSHDAAGNLTGQVDPDGRIQEWFYDLAGRRTLVRRPNGTGIAYSYDAAGRPDTLTPTESFADSFTQPNGTLPDGNTWLSVIGTRATMAVDSHAVHATVGAPSGSSATLASKAPATGGGDMTFNYQWDSASTSTPLRVYHAYTSDSQAYRVQIAANSTTGYIYKTLAGTTTTLGTFIVPVDTDLHWLRFVQDGNQLKVKIWDDGDPEPGSWAASVTDSTGPLADGTTRIQVTSGSGTNNGVVLDDVTYTDLETPPTALVDYSWDDDGHLTGEDLPGTSARAWSWTDGQLTGMTQTAPGVTRQAANTLSYDTAGRLASIDHGSGLGEAWTYDNAGQVLSETVDGGATRSWTYDTLGRRATETVSGNTTTNTYDTAGQLTVTDPPVGSNATYTYDAAGRRVTESPSTGGTFTYTYNPAGQLDTYTSPGSEVQTRGYDPDGAVDTLTNTISAGTSHWTIDWDHTGGLAEVAAITDQASSGNATVTTTLARADSSIPWATGTRGATPYTLGSDPLGSTLSTTGNNIARASQYDTWGIPTGSGTLNPKLGYRGEITNKNLINLRARNYQPITGQFLTTDPLQGVTGTPTHNNPYHYTDNNPGNRVDPSGMRTGEETFLLASLTTPWFADFTPWHEAAKQALYDLVAVTEPLAEMECNIPYGGLKERTDDLGRGLGVMTNGRADVCTNRRALGNPYKLWEVKYFGPEGFAKAQNQLARYIAAGTLSSGDSMVVGEQKAPTLTKASDGQDVFAFSVGDTGVRLYFPMKWLKILRGHDDRRSFFDGNVSEGVFDRVMAAAGRTDKLPTAAPGGIWPSIPIPLPPVRFPVFA